MLNVTISEQPTSADSPFKLKDFIQTVSWTVVFPWHIYLIVIILALQKTQNLQEHLNQGDVSGWI